MRRAVLQLLLLLTAVSCSKQPPPPPPPPPPKPAAITVPFDFVVYGDCITPRSTHCKVHRHICDAIARTDARFVIQTGDMFNDKNVTVPEFEEVVRDLRAKAPYYAVKGNHDAQPAGRFEKEFGLSKPYYDVVAADVHLFFLDSNELFQDAEQLDWLRKAAEASTARHKIAVLHHCPVALREAREEEVKQLLERLQPILVKNHFCAAFCGHEHLFYTTVLDGVRYVVTGGGGSHLVDVREEKLRPGDIARSVYHYVVCHVDEHGIGARVFGEDGEEIPDLQFPVCEHK